MEHDKLPMRRLATRLMFTLPVVLLASLMAAQDSGALNRDLTSDSAEANAEIAAFLREGLPQEKLTFVSLYVLNQPKITIPLLVNEIKMRMVGGERDAHRAEVAAEMIAYAASLESIDAFADLVQLDEQRFLLYVTTSLRYAVPRQRQFDLAAYATERYPALVPTIRRWLKDAMVFSKTHEKLAAAVLQEASLKTGSEDRLRSLVNLLEPDARRRYDSAFVRMRARSVKRSEAQPRD